MFVTLDVSKLSGWLNADAYCRVERRACDAERGVGREAGRRGSAAAHERHARREGPAVKGLWQGMGGAHTEHAFHGLDAGRVEGQRLIERRRRLPSRKKGTCICAMWCVDTGGLAQERMVIVGRECSRRVQGGSRWRPQRTWNMFLMSVTQEVSQLERSSLKSLKSL